jgi:hypothetical protein
MRFRKLRIALSVVCGIACVLLVAFWARSYSTEEQPSSFGHSQVEQFICDRLGVGEIINREPALRALLESGFAGDLTGGQRVYWDCREPIAATSERYSAYTEYPSLVRVTGKLQSSAVDKCFMLVFELQHGPFERNRDSLFNMAMRGRISRNDFARSCVRLEFQAAMKTQEFFRRHPLADGNSEENPHYASIMGIPGEFSDYIHLLEGPDSKKDNVLQYYLACYDEYVPTGLGNGATNTDATK